MLIKICGNTTRENLSQIESLNPDLIGLIFYPKSKRFVKDQLVNHDFRVPAVGVFVNESLTNMQKTAANYKLKHLQLHGDETPETCRVLLSAGYTVYKAFGIENLLDVEKTAAFNGTCSFYLFDTKTPDRGGSGRTFDWQILHAYKGETPFFLSGGIGLENIREALKLDHPQFKGIDLNSKLEIKPGIKDIKQTERIIQIIKNHERN
ncbi:phosphoribosylanthranilate isomerase [Parvicella tangerina]|uniref:N-(5'-phosphoribosyl)anthranilate isomerase n=1 Tax=Parvicella tangerina TaxID=2829795 RepID=A0A916NIF2_9FLAO|nr:phosphoribosylanthranilate isomerase [Parvicella tangerina]CAG5083917.1 N-(5'-phosphoribosyl)anthranilate isomerase [Parvicella tangerina]